jgi:hypothetical protein
MEKYIPTQNGYYNKSANLKIGDARQLSVDTFDIEF